MNLGFDGKLYILAFDHRGSFQKKFFGVEGEPTAEEAAKISDAKTVIYEGMLQALQDGADRSAAGVLVDEQFGADVAHKAKAEGLMLAMPVEKSGEDEFEFGHGSLQPRRGRCDERAAVRAAPGAGGLAARQRQEVPVRAPGSGREEPAG